MSSGGELPGFLLVHDTIVRSNVEHAMMGKGWENGVNLFVFDSGLTALEYRSRWENQIMTVGVHKDLFTDGMDAETFLRLIGGRDLFAFPFYLLILSGEATDKGVSERVVRGMYADALWDVANYGIGNLLQLLADPDGIIGDAREQGLTRGVNVLWEGSIATPNYIMHTGRGDRTGHLDGYGYG
jgi:hypothetical protein